MSTSVMPVEISPNSLSTTKPSITPKSFEIVKGGAYCYKCGGTFTYQYWYMHEGSCDTLLKPSDYDIIGDYDDDGELS